MEQLVLEIERFPYTAQTTSGKLAMIYDGKKEFFGFTLEDTARPSNIKVMENTCIPPGEYKISLYESLHYGKTLIIHTEDDKRTIKVGELKWEGCLFHGGNTHVDTAGCILIAKNRIDNDHIQGSLKTELRNFVEKKMNEGYEVKLRIINLTQTR